MKTHTDKVSPQAEAPHIQDETAKFEIKSPAPRWNGSSDHLAMMDEDARQRRLKAVKRKQHYPSL